MSLLSFVVVCSIDNRRHDMPSLSNVGLPRVQPRLGQFIAPNHVVARWAALVVVVIGERNRLGGPTEDKQISASCRDQYGRGLMCYSKKGNSPGTRRIRRAWVREVEQLPQVRFGCVVGLHHSTSYCIRVMSTTAGRTTSRFIGGNHD